MADQSQEEHYPGIPVFTLSELNTAIKVTLERAFPESVWVVAEISEMRCNSRGHCYLELVEREEEETSAESRANIWAYTFRILSSKFEKATGETLKQGMKVLLHVNVTFHEVYGLSLNVRDIDPTYSIGEMVRTKREVIKRLTKAGVLNLNKQIPLPLVPQRIAVISSAMAAGYGDFVDHIDNNSPGYKINYALYQALMQGQEAEKSILSCLKEISEKMTLYDAVAIIRGGGSKIDLSCFDSYNLAFEVATFPLPVITGIGHERDDTVVDMVAHTKLKTPTAVAEFLISGMGIFEERLLDAESALINHVRELLREENHRLQNFVQQFRHIVRHRLSEEVNTLGTALHRLIYGTTQIIEGHNNRLKLGMNRLSGGLRIVFHEHKSRLKTFEHAIRLLDPVNVMKRGYSVTYLRGKAIKNSKELVTGDIIRTEVYKGNVNSKVEALDVEE